MGRTIDFATELAEGFVLPPFGIPLDDIKSLSLAGSGQRLHARQYGRRFDEEVLPFISSAHLACGAHSGDPVLIRRVASDLKSRGVHMGAHPSYPDAFGFGQKRMDLADDELEAVLLYQIGALSAVLGGIGVRLEHVKCHGRLQFDVSYEERCCNVLTGAVRKFDPDMILVFMAESPGLAFARAKGLRVAAEAYADRPYEPSGRIVSVNKPGGLMADPERSARQIVEIVCEGKVTCIDGTTIKFHADSICIHSDTPGAGHSAAAVLNALKKRGVAIAPLLQTSPSVR